MPRANRHHIPGQVWHITHRCHEKEFLLKFSRDRRRWLHWLFEAKKRYGLQIFNYTITSNAGTYLATQMRFIGPQISTLIRIFSDFFLFFLVENNL